MRELLSRPVVLYGVVEEAWNLKDLVIGYEPPTMPQMRPPFRMTLDCHGADFDRLFVSIKSKGICSPLITYKEFVLVGLRRAYIGRKLGIKTVNVWRITEDVDHWTRENLPRLKALNALNKIGY